MLVLGKKSNLLQVLKSVTFCKAWTNALRKRLFMTAFNLCHCIQWSLQNQESVWRQQRNLLLEETWVSPWARKGSKLLFPLSITLSCSSAGKESICNVGDLGLILGLGRSPGEGKDFPAPVFWPGEFHGLYSWWGCKESDTTDQLSLIHHSYLSENHSPNHYSENKVLLKNKFSRKGRLVSSDTRGQVASTDTGVSELLREG